MKNISGDLDARSITGRPCDSDSWTDCAKCGAKKLRDENALLRQRLTTAEGVVTGLERSLEAVARERDEAREQLTDMLKLMLPRPAGEPALVADTLNVPLTGSPLVLRVVEAMVSMLREGPGNFRSISFKSTKDGQEYSLTIQREGGKTPAQRITELECDIEKTVEQFHALEKDYAEAISARDGWENEYAKTEAGYQAAQKDVEDLRRKIGEWAADIEAGKLWPGLLTEMREAWK